MNSTASLISSLLADTYQTLSFVDRTYGEPLFHTESEVVAVAFAPDDTIWSIEDAGILRHYSADGHLLDREFLSDLESCWVFDAQAKRVASGSNDVAIWDCAQATEIARVTTDAWATVVCFSPDGQLLASGHDDGQVVIWNATSLKSIIAINGHTDAISSLAFSPDGKELVTAGDDHLIRCWDVTTGKMTREWRGHTDRIPGIAWHPQGQYLISVGWDTTARVWVPGQADPQMLLNAHSDQVNAITIDPKGELVACSDSDFAIHLWSDARGGKTKFILQGHTDEIRTLAFNATGTRLASAGADRVVHLWDVSTGRLIAGPNPTARQTVAVSQDRVFASAGTGIKAWDTNTNEPTWTPDTKLVTNFVAASADGQWLAVSGLTPNVELWNTQSKTLAQVLNHTKGPIACPVFSSDSTHLATASQSDGLIWIWQIGKPEAILVIPEAADNSTLEALAYHPSGKYVAVGGHDFLSTSGSDGSLCVWDLEARDKFLTIEAGVTSLAFDTQGKYLAAGTYSRNAQSVLVWDFEKQEKVFDLGGHYDRINAVAFNPDGSWLVSASDDCTIRVWNIISGHLVVARQFDAAVQSLAFSADGKYLYTGNGNTTCHRLEMKKLLED